VLVAFLRGVNVGGHRRFRPALLANELAEYDVVNVGATGLYVIRGRVSPETFRRRLLVRLPFETHVAVCDARDILALEESNPFPEASREDMVPFVSVLCAPARHIPTMPISIPETGEWYVRIIGRHGPFVFGFYRKHMKTISYLGKIDAALGVPSTTRTWRTIGTVLRILRP
jgi:uncharacterized protein (DUF1697 family)